MMQSVTSINATDLRISIVSDEATFGELAQVWNTWSGSVPFRSWEWAETWWRHYRDPRSHLFVLVIRDEQGSPLGIAPWYIHRSAGLGRVVHFLGSGEICSDYLTLLAEPEAAEAVADRVADWLVTEGARHWDLLDFEGVDKADPSMTAICDRLVERGRVVERQADMSCWRAELPGDWNQFLTGLSKSRRERTKSLLRKTVDTSRAVVHEVSNEQELAEAFEIFIDLHQKRRQSLSQPGCFASPRFTAFHREMGPLLLAAGQLRMLWIELDGRPMAVEYSFVGDDTVYYYQGGFDPELADESPGWLSFAISLRQANAAGYRVYDFLRGDEPYKASWGAVARPLVHVRVVGVSASARARYATWHACKELKAWARRLFSRERG